MVAAMAMFSPASADSIVAKAGKLNAETLTKLDHPWSLALLPDDRLLITEKTGSVRTFDGKTLSEPLVGVRKVAYRAQGGLLGIALHPEFSTNNLVYLSYVEAAEQQPAGAKDPGDPRLGEYQQLDDVTLKGLAVARGRLDGTALTDVTVIWRQQPKTVGRGHFGGQLVFAPDGKLIVTSGDRQRFDPAQDPAANVGKIVRINDDGSLPEDRVFEDQSSGSQDILSLGHRNPLGIAIDPKTGIIWEHEMGPKGGDEVNVIEKGANYGWPLVSEGSHYDDRKIPSHSDNQKFKAPVLSWNPSISPSGLIFYQGNLFPTWTGKALMGGLSSKALFVLGLSGDQREVEERIEMGFRVRDVIEARDGSLFILKDHQDADEKNNVAEDEGALIHLTPARERATEAR